MACALPPVWLLILVRARDKMTERLRRQALSYWEDIFMQWTAPAFEEVCLNCEINSYVSAKL